MYTHFTLSQIEQIVWKNLIRELKLPSLNLN